MKNIIPFLAVILFSCTSTPNKDWKETEQNFRTMPLSVRPNPLWFWNDSKVGSGELKQQMEAYKEAGYGGLSILPFGKNFEPKYLTDEYFDTYGGCLEEAKKLGLTLWIYDEYGFPSGTAGDINGDGVGRFRQKYPEHTNKRLDKTEYKIRSGQIFEKMLPQGLLMAAIAMDTVTHERIDLSSNILDNKLKWQSPKGNWKVMFFTCVDAGNTIVDYMSPEAVNLYINMTHDEYYKRFPEYFKNTVIGTFFDEPTLYYAQGRSWTPKFNTEFEERYGFSPALYYPALWYDIGPKTAEARNYLFGFRTELYASGYPKQVTDWSQGHGIMATGHQDNEEIINCVGTSGDLMKCFKYQDIPGIDKIGGDRPAERFYKIISSAAYNWDHHLVMSETYGAMGNISWTEIFGIAMEQYAKGINLLIPHAVWYDTSKVVFKPELSLRNPLYADSLKIFTDYLSRLNSLMQNDARWTGDIAVLYPIQTMQSGHYMDGPRGAYKGGVEIPDLDYVDIGVTLFDELGYDFMFLHPEVFDDQCYVSDKLILNNDVNNYSFSTLIVPGCKTISLSNLEKIYEFAMSGGRIIFTTALPEKATIQADDTKIDSLVQEILSSTTAVFVKDPQPSNLKAALEEFPENYSLRFIGGTSIGNIHKILNDKNIWFFANPGKKATTTEIEINGEYDLEAWDPHTGDAKVKLKMLKRGGKTKVRLALDGNKSLFLVEK